MPGCAGMASIRANAEDEDSEEDADFDMKSEEDDGGEPSDDSEVESGDAEMIEEQPKVSPASAHVVSRGATIMQLETVQWVTIKQSCHEGVPACAPVIPHGGCYS